MQGDRAMTASLRRLVDHVEHFQHRVIADAVLDASATRWLMRADEFEAARPRHGDFHGQATREQLRARWAELTEIANACRAKASLLREEGMFDVLAAVDDVLEELSA
jgi:hypothetical protein